MRLKCPMCYASGLRVLETLPILSLKALCVRAWGEGVLREFPDEDQDIKLCECEHCGVKFFLPILCGSPSFYEIIQKASFYYLDEKNEYNVAARYVFDEAKVLEIGAGRGAFFKKIKNCNYTGIETSDSAANMAVAEGINVQVETLEDHAAKYSGLYDIVCAFQVLEHVPDPRTFVDAALRCLRKGGFMILSVPNEDSYVSLLSNAILNMPPHHVTRWTVRALRNLALLFPIEVVELERDRLWPRHVQSYATVIVLRSLYRFLGREIKLIEVSLADRVLQNVSERLARVLALALNDSRLWPDGHSITGVFRKI